MNEKNELIIEALKKKFMDSMVWKSKAVELFDFDEVQTLVLGNINGFSGLVKEALDSKDALLENVIHAKDRLFDTEMARKDAEKAVVQEELDKLRKKLA